MICHCFNLQVNIFKGNNICLISLSRLFAQPCCLVEEITATAQPGITNLYSTAHPRAVNLHSPDQGEMRTQGYENPLLLVLSKHFACGQLTEFDPQPFSVNPKFMKTSAVDVHVSFQWKYSRMLSLVILWIVRQWMNECIVYECIFYTI